MLRGEVWTGAGGGYLSKSRPVLVIQSDQFDATRSVTVCPLTSDSISAELPIFRIPVSDAVGLSKQSWVQVDKVTTTRRNTLVQRIGSLDRETMIEVERSIVTFLGIS